jgi:hypothetical protein
MFLYGGMGTYPGLWGPTKHVPSFPASGGVRLMLGHTNPQVALKRKAIPICVQCRRVVFRVLYALLGTEKLGLHGCGSLYLAL